MIDRANFKRLNANYEFPQLKTEQQEQQTNGWAANEPPLPPPGLYRGNTNEDLSKLLQSLVYSNVDSSIFSDMGVPTLRVSTTNTDIEKSMTEQDFLLATPTLYGFSLADKLWRKYPTVDCDNLS